MNKFNLMIFIAMLAVVIAIPIYASQEFHRISDAKAQIQAQSIENGTALYLEFCVDCHGPNGQGVEINPALNRLGISDADPDLLFNVIARAVHGSAMAAWHLGQGGIFNDYQIQELVTFIKYADWSQVEEIAVQNGIAVQGIASLNIEDISTSTMSEDDPHQCIACHEDPPVHLGRFGLDCVRCHSLSAWTPASLTRHTFKIDHGDQGEQACEICHTDTYAENTCYTCHDHQPDEMDELHKSEGIQNYDDCQSCHPTGAKDEGRNIWQDFLDNRNKNNHSAASDSAH